MKKGLLFVLLTLICLSFVGCAKSKSKNPYTTIEEKPIKSCILDSSKSQTANGSFVLGIGSYKSSSSINVTYYIYMKGNEGYVLQDLDSNNVEIVETNDKKPCIKGVFDKFGRIYKGEYVHDGFAEVRYDGINKYVIYVPEGYIKEDYSNDLKEKLKN